MESLSALRRRSLAVPLSVAAHVALGLALFGGAVAPRRGPVAVPEVAMEVVFEPAPVAGPPVLIAAAAIPASAVPAEVAAIAPLRRMFVPAAPSSIRVVRPVAPPARAVHSVVRSPVAAAPPPTVAAEPGFSLVGFEAQVHRAVQAAAAYPAAARLQRREGRAEIRFDYQDGGVRDAAVAQSSRSGVLDRAALEAVERASLPRPPGVRRLTMLVWVDFSLMATD